MKPPTTIISRVGKKNHSKGGDCEKTKNNDS